MAAVPPYRIDRDAFDRFFNQWAREAKREGRRPSARSLAIEAGVSHTLILQVRNGRDSAGMPKTHVNMETARDIELALNAPPSIIFKPDASPVTSDAAA